MKKKKKIYGKPVFRGIDNSIINSAADILYLEGVKWNLIIWHANCDEIVVAESLKEKERTLDPDIFFRSSKSGILNMQHVVSYRRERSIIKVLLTNKKEIDVSQRNKSDFIKAYRYFLITTRDSE